MKAQNQANFLLHILGYAAIIVSAAWLLFCFIQIDVYGIAVFYEPNLFIRLSETAVYIYASAYAIYITNQFLKKESDIGRDG